MKTVRANESMNGITISLVNLVRTYDIRLLTDYHGRVKIIASVVILQVGPIMLKSRGSITW